MSTRSLQTVCTSIQSGRRVKSVNKACPRLAWGTQEDVLPGDVDAGDGADQRVLLHGNLLEFL